MVGLAIPVMYAHDADDAHTRFLRELLRRCKQTPLPNNERMIDLINEELEKIDAEERDDEGISKN